MKKIDYDVSVDLAHLDGLPGYAQGEAIRVFTDSPHENLLIQDRNHGRVIILPYKQIVNASYGTKPSNNGDMRAATGFLVGGATGALIGAASADPTRKLVVIQYISSAGDTRYITLTETSASRDVKDLVAILQSRMQGPKSGPTYL